MWHKWNGGENPVSGKKVIFKTERWFEKQPRVSDDLDWGVRGMSAIVEYKVVDDLQSRTNDEFDTVQRPAHYNQSGIECIDAIAAAVKGKSGIEAALVSNVIKYLWRYELKNGVEDVRKARWYLDRLVKELSK